MPRPTKLQKAKRIRETRVVYISIELDPLLNDHSHWVEWFYEQLQLAAADGPEVFKDVRRTGGATAGTPLSQLTEDVTDWVSVLTNRYLVANIDRGGVAAAGELAQFLGRAVPKDDSDKQPPQFFLAPLELPIWTTVRIRKVPLNDPRFIRLRDAQFTWPSQGPPMAKAEIAEAVVRIADA